MDDYLAKPVRPEDVRRIVERWGSAAAMKETASPTVAQTATGTGSLEASAAPPPPANEKPPVDMERLLDFTNGNADDLRELINLYVRQTSEQVAQLQAAVQAESAVEVRRLAHSCAGASATCGMSGIVPMLRELERQGNDGKLTTARELSQQVSEEFNRIRAFLESYLQRQTALAARP